jgi:hypothetical protein
MPKIVTISSMDRLERILTVVYVVQNSQNFSGNFPSFCIPKNTTFRNWICFRPQVKLGEKTSKQDDGKSPEKFCEFCTISSFLGRRPVNIKIPFPNKQKLFRSANKCKMTIFFE